LKRINLKPEASLRSARNVFLPALSPHHNRTHTLTDLHPSASSAAAAAAASSPTATTHTRKNEKFDHGPTPAGVFQIFEPILCFIWCHLLDPSF